MLTVAVAGASGYAGGELLRLLDGHPDVQIGALAAGRQAGTPLATVHPHLPSLGDRVFDETTADVLAGHDVVFLALPHGESAAVAATIADDVLVVDLGADHRLVDPHAWTSSYGGRHPGSWPYGLPELPGGRVALAGTTRIAAPGCFPTAVALALVPAVAHHLVTPSDVVVTATTGTSGAGRTPDASLLASELIGSARAYQVGGVHRHTPEMEQLLRAAAGTPGTASTQGTAIPDVSVSFTPVLVPMTRGIVAVCSAPASPGVELDDLLLAYQKETDGEPFWHLLGEGSWPQAQSVAGSNSAHVQVALDTHAGRVVAVCAIDNLGKGAAGSAVQSMNIALGLPEQTGLTTGGLAP